MRSMDAKECNGIYVCFLVSSVGESKELFGYIFNNAHLPKLTFQCLFTQTSMISAIFAVNYLG